MIRTALGSVLCVLAILMVMPQVTRCCVSKMTFQRLTFPTMELAEAVRTNGLGSW